MEKTPQLPNAQSAVLLSRAVGSQIPDNNNNINAPIILSTFASHMGNLRQHPPLPSSSESTRIRMLSNLVLENSTGPSPPLSAASASNPIIQVHNNNNNNNNLSNNNNNNGLAALSVNNNGHGKISNNNTTTLNSSNPTRVLPRSTHSKEEYAPLPQPSVGLRGGFDLHKGFSVLPNMQPRLLRQDPAPPPATTGHYAVPATRALHATAQQDPLRRDTGIPDYAHSSSQYVLASSAPSNSMHSHSQAQPQPQSQTHPHPHFRTPTFDRREMFQEDAPSFSPPLSSAQGLIPPQKTDYFSSHMPTYLSRKMTHPQPPVYPTYDQTYPQQIFIANRGAPLPFTIRRRNASKACENCKRQHTRCSDTRPCTNCQLKRLPCREVPEGKGEGESIKKEEPDELNSPTSTAATEKREQASPSVEKRRKLEEAIADPETQIFCSWELRDGHFHPLRWNQEFLDLVSGAVENVVESQIKGLLFDDVLKPTDFPFLKQLHLLDGSTKQLRCYATVDNSRLFTTYFSE